MKHLGDITKINGADVPIVDIVCGGSPCQDLSVAGQRKGLQHSALGDGETTRSGLFMEQIRIIKEMRNECIRQLSMRGAAYSWRDIRPRYMVWENVPGAFSSNKGEDFRCVLEETVRIIEENAVIPRLEGGAKWSPSGAIMGDGWSVAWRVHDAQFWGVPQRRKRISLVADFAGQSAPEILFERKSLSRDIEESRAEGQGIARTTSCGIDKAISFQERAGCAGGGKGILIQHERTGALSTLNNQSVFSMGHDERSARFTDDEITDPLTASDYKDPIKICVSQDAYDKYTQNDKAASLKQSGGNLGGGQRDISDTVGALCARDFKGVGSQYVDEGKCIIQRIE